ncbi:MAG: tRNA lysidine(34) synthetase TilS [Puniceicoccales bacterium]|jgi:tRNA(Ile)-lysidine synthetase-like protein|nr:tRNA lysidine(34) synthetase TilS [Puniceicoccales bacterium]
MTGVALSPAVLTAVGALPNCPLCVACSGGSDSVALVHLLHASSLRERLVIVHFDHRAGRKTSARDGEFVKNLAWQLALPCEIATRALEEKIPSGESGLRMLRLKFFRRCMARHGTPFLATAHQRDDALETLLLRLARGGNLEALTAPRTVQRFRDGSIHLRPLLHSSKADLVKFLKVNGWTWCEDETNGMPCHTRNRIRLQLIPLWRTFEPRRNWERSLLRSRKLLEEDQDALASWAEKIYGQSIVGNCLKIFSLRSEPPAIQRRVLHRYFTDRELTVGAATVDALLTAIAENRKLRLTLPRGRNCLLNGQLLSIDPPGVGQQFSNQRTVNADCAPAF